MILQDAGLYDSDKLTNIDEKELEALLNNPNLPADVRLRLIEELKFVYFHSTSSFIETFF